MHSKEIDPIIPAASSSSSTSTGDSPSRPATSSETTLHPVPPPDSLPPTSQQASYITNEELAVQQQAQTVHQWPRTDQRQPRPLYFAYGSNLSFTQMRMRCIHDPDISSKPVAIARLDGWRWQICQAGYANVVPPEVLRVGRQVTEGGCPGHLTRGGDVVYGVLYEMTPADEFVLDGYEGVDHSAREAAAAAAAVKSTVDDGASVTNSQRIRPREQGLGDYNKWYVMARVIKWLDEKQRIIRTRGQRGDDHHGSGPSHDLQQVLVYVDEDRVCVGPPKREYILRMNRAIREAETLGFPKQWVRDVMRKHIPEF